MTDRKSIPKGKIMNVVRRITAASHRLDVFAIIEKALTAASLALVALTVGGQLGEMIGLHGKAGTVVAWSIAIVYDALWIGSLRMSEVAIRQRSTVGIVVMLGLSAVAVGVSSTILLLLGHAKVFAFVPVAAALFMGLRLFAGNVLADTATAAEIAEQSAADRNARALAAADARHLQSEATTDVVTETAKHLAEMERQIARADVLTKAQARINKARAEAEERLQKSETEHGAKALAFAERDLILAVSRPAVTAGGDTLAELDGHTVVTQASPEIEPVTVPPVTAPETDPEETSEQAPIGDGMTLEDLAAIEGVDTPQPGVTLSDEQLAIVLRWLRYSMEPPRSYRQAQKEFRAAGFTAREERVRRIWGEIETNEATAHA
jgi:TolA-binding protein